MDLRETGVGETGAALVGAPDGGGVGVARVGRKIEDVAVAAGGEHDRVGDVAADLPVDEVADDDALRMAVDDDEVEHLRVREHFHGAEADHARECGVGAEEELLAGLAAGVEGARHLRAAEGAVGKEAAVFAGEGHTLRHALVDDVARDLGQAVDVGLAGAEITALDRVVEEPEDAVAVVLVVLGRVDSALGGDRVRPARAVMKDEAAHAIAELGECRRRRGPGEAGADHDDLVLPLVRGIDEPALRLVPGPLLIERAGRDSGFESGHGGKRLALGDGGGRDGGLNLLRGVGAMGRPREACQNGAGNRQVAEEVENAAEDDGLLEETRPWAALPTERLKHALGAMRQVKAQQADRDDIEQRDRRVGETQEHHAVDVVHLPAPWPRPESRGGENPTAILYCSGSRLEVAASAPIPR